MGCITSFYAQQVLTKRMLMESPAVAQFTKYKMHCNHGSLK